MYIMFRRYTLLMEVDWGRDELLNRPILATKRKYSDDRVVRWIDNDERAVVSAAVLAILVDYVGKPMEPEMKTDSMRVKSVFVGNETGLWCRTYNI